MSQIAECITASEASKRLGVSTKALRLYEQRGLISPIRTEAGWRVYGPEEISRATRIVALRELGLSLGQITRVLDGDAQALDQALAAHQLSLRSQMEKLGDAMKQVDLMRTKLADGQATDAANIAQLIDRPDKLRLAFSLPWPWGGERFELRDVQPLTFITGPLGSGKTRLAKRIAEEIPDAAYLGLERFADDASSTTSQMENSPDHRSRVEQAMDWLLDEGATPSKALTTLVVALEAEARAGLVVDMPEQDLDDASQHAVAAYVRHRADNARPLFMLTRSTAILDLALVGRNETIIYCPANHSPPILVEAIKGKPGFEAVATCLAAPDVRARTKGVVAIRRRAG